LRVKSPFLFRRRAVSVDEMKALFYIGLGMQLFGLTAVGLCFVSGIRNGDYGRLELIQLVGGSLIFYVGNYLKGRSAN
jgi:hypothetical protein